MSLFSLTLAPLLALQSAGETAVAIENDTPETWTVEYPRIITPFVQDYRRCLNVANRLVTGKPDFEVQHRADLVRCEKASLEAQEESNRILAGREGYGEFGPKDIREVFEHLGNIHVARGADLDKQFQMTLTASSERADNYEEERRNKGLIIEMRDASVVQSRAEAAGQQGVAE